VRITSSAICGSDIHLCDGYIPTMQQGDILGHEFMGAVVEVGAAVKNLCAGDRVVVPIPIACQRRQRRWGAEALIASGPIRPAAPRAGAGDFLGILAAIVVRAAREPRRPALHTERVSYIAGTPMLVPR